MKIPVLLYHDIKEDDFDILNLDYQYRPYVLRKSDFITQLEWLHRNNFRTIGLLDLVRKLEDEQLEELNNRTVALVFDDGWLSSYEIVFPLLSKYGFGAIFFITLDYTDKEGMMNWSQIKELADNGMEIGSHSLTHQYPFALKTPALEFELKESKRILEERLNRKINFFSSPTGFFDARIIKIAQEAGYRGVCFSRVKFTDFSQNNGKLLILNKIGIKRNYSLAVFKGIVQEKVHILAFLRAKQILRNYLKSFLSQSGYNRMKSLLLKRAS